MSVIIGRVSYTREPKEFTAPWYKRIFCFCKKTEASNTWRDIEFHDIRCFQCEKCGRWWADNTPAERRYYRRAMFNYMMGGKYDT